MPKIMGSSILEHREHTRRALFDALSSLMRERGFDAVSMSDLAARAGIGRTAIYNHFTDKEDLLLAFVEDEMSGYLDRVHHMLEEHSEPLDQLRIYVRSQLLAERTYLMSPGPPLKDVITPATGHRLRQHVVQSSELLREILSEAIEAGVLPEQDISLCIQLVNGTLTGRRVPREEPARTAFFHATELFIIRALGAEVPEELPDLGPIPPPCSESGRQGA